MAKEFKISALRLKELEQELFYLKTTREKEVAEQIKAVPKGNGEFAPHSSRLLDVFPDSCYNTIIPNRLWRNVSCES